MVRFKGRSAWKTVIKGKPTPIGYKVYTVASHGYLLSFEVYKGKGGYATRQGVIHHEHHIAETKPIVKQCVCS